MKLFPCRKAWLYYLEKEKHTKINLYHWYPTFAIHFYFSVIFPDILRRLKIEVFFLSNISPPYISSPNIGPSDLSFVRICVQGVLIEFYGIIFTKINPLTVVY